MRLSSLSIRNFRVLREVDLAFGDDVIGITGPNGGGKTSIIEAIAWALYGTQAARSGKEEIKSTFARPEEDCEVRLDFLIHDEKYRVIRRLVGRTERAEVELYRGEAAESVGVNETKKYVGELLGLDWKGFLTSFLARQQELNALSILPPAKRKDHLAGMLGIDKLERAIVKVKESAKIAAGQADVLSRQVAQQETLEETIRLLTARKADLERSAGQAESARAAAERVFGTARDEYMKAQEARSQWLQVGAHLEAARRTAGELARRLEDHRREAAQLAAAEQEAAACRSELRKLDPARKELDALTDARSRTEYRAQLQRQLADLEKEQKSASAGIGETEKMLAAVGAQLSAIPEAVAADLEKCRADLEQARGEYSRVQAEQKALETQRDRLAAQMKSIAAFGPDSVCDRCLRPLGDDLERIKGHLSEELAGLNTAIAGFAAELKKATESGTRLKAHATALEAAANRRKELGIERDAALREKKLHTARLEDTAGRIEQVRLKLMEAGTVEFDPARYDSVRREVDRLGDVGARLNRLEGALARREAVAAETARTESTLAAANTEIEELTGRRESLGYSEESFTGRKVAFETAQRQFESARDRALAVAKEAELTAREIDGKNEQLALLRQARLELEEHRSRHYYGEKLAGLFAEFREVLIARIRPTLSDISGRLLAEMTDGRYTMVELDERYNLQVLDGGQFFGVERFSGGEKDLANLCLRLAISQALIESAGMNRSFVILDEVFASQDDGRKELIIRALTNLKHRFPQIFLITHIGDIRDRVESLIEVAPTGLGWSKVTAINGSAA